MNEEWFAIVADRDVFYPEDYPNPEMRGKLEYKKGDVVSYGSVIAEKEHLDAKGLRAVSIGFSAPNHETHAWNPKTERMEEKGVEHA